MTHQVVWMDETTHLVKHMPFYTRYGYYVCRGLCNWAGPYPNEEALYEIWHPEELSMPSKEDNP